MYKFRKISHLIDLYLVLLYQIYKKMSVTNRKNQIIFKNNETSFIIFYVTDIYSQRSK